jgi:hypothetical protein
MEKQKSQFRTVYGIKKDGKQLYQFLQDANGNMVVGSFKNLPKGKTLDDIAVKVYGICGPNAKKPGEKYTVWKSKDANGAFVQGTYKAENWDENNPEGQSDMVTDENIVV